MNKIKVKPEGREGVYLVSKKEITKFVKNLEVDTIHHFFGGSSMFIGADHKKSSVLEDIEKSERIAIVTDKAGSMTIGHMLSVIIDNKLNMFDIGEIKDSDLEIIKKIK